MLQRVVAMATCAEVQSELGAFQPESAGRAMLSRELIDFTRRLWVSAGLSIPLLILTMGSDMAGNLAATGRRGKAWRVGSRVAPCAGPGSRRLPPRFPPC